MDKFILALLVVAGFFGLMVLSEKASDDEKKGNRFTSKLVMVIVGLLFLYGLVKGCTAD